MDKTWELDWVERGSVLTKMEDIAFHTIGAHKHTKKDLQQQLCSSIMFGRRADFTVCTLDFLIIVPVRLFNFENHVGLYAFIGDLYDYVF